MIGAIAASSSGWEKTKFVFQVERAYEKRGIFFVSLSSQHILKITPLVKNPREQASVNAFAIFTFSTQFNSPWGWGELPYMGYIGMCDPKRVGFLSGFVHQ